MATVSSADSAIVPTNRGIFPLEHATALVSFARPADTTAYSINDVVSDSTGTARALAFDVGRSGLVVGASLVVAETDTADFDLLLFDAEPTNFLDNAALALVAADQPKLLGMFRFLQGAGARINVGTNMELYRAVSAGTDQSVAPIAFSTASFLFGLLVTRSAYTPISACKFAIRLSVLRKAE